MKKVLALLLTAALIACLFAGCTSLDYNSAEDLESALNSGADVSGKTAKIKIDEVNSGLMDLYYTGWAGEHLNLISESEPDFEAGDIIKIRVTKVSSLLGSWLIAYTLIK